MTDLKTASGRVKIEKKQELINDVPQAPWWNISIIRESLLATERMVFIKESEVLALKEALNALDLSHPTEV